MIKTIVPKLKDDSEEFTVVALVVQNILM